MKRMVRSNSDSNWIISKNYTELLTNNISKIDTFDPHYKYIKRKNQINLNKTSK